MLSHYPVIPEKVRKRECLASMGFLLWREENVLKPDRRGTYRTPSALRATELNTCKRLKWLKKFYALYMLPH